MLERHILASVEEFHQRIEKEVLGPNDSLFTAGVKDFVVLGKHRDFAKMAASILDGKFADKVILFLRRNLCKRDDRG